MSGNGRELGSDYVGSYHTLSCLFQVLRAPGIRQVRKTLPEQSELNPEGEIGAGGLILVRGQHESGFSSINHRSHPPPRS
jgi:hypothetical protein